MDIFPTVSCWVQCSMSSHFLFHLVIFPVSSIVTIASLRMSAKFGVNSMLFWLKFFLLDNESSKFFFFFDCINSPSDRAAFCRDLEGLKDLLASGKCSVGCNSGTCREFAFLALLYFCADLITGSLTSSTFILNLVCSIFLHYNSQTLSSRFSSKISRVNSSQPWSDLEKLCRGKWEKILQKKVLCSSE